MKNFLIAIAAVAFSLFSCSTLRAQPETRKALILYYSQTGSTKAVAEELQRLVGADIERIEAEIPYDGNYTETIERCRKEKETGQLPKLKTIKSNLNHYNIIFLGYPIWFGTYAMPMESFIKSVHLTGKKIVPFCTFGSGGLYETTESLRNVFQDAEILEGYGVRTARLGKMPKELDYFLKKNGHIDGEVVTLPEFSEQTPVTEDDERVFNAACGDYQFPLGTPLTVGYRDTKEERQYKFTVSSMGMNGEKTTSVIYVIAGKEKGAKPEFTQVVR